MIPFAMLLASAAPCTGAVCNFDTLAPWFARLDGMAHVKWPAIPAHIIQIGDSHTAGDALTAGWRKLLQAPWPTVLSTYEGVGSRGMLPPGRPYDGYFTQGATVMMSDGWKVSATFGKGSAASPPPIGLSGYSLTSTRPGASMALTAARGMAFTRFVLCGLAGPGAGSVTVRFDEDLWEDSLDFERKEAAPLCQEFPAELPVSKVRISVQGSPVTLTSWGVFSAGGVALSNLGIVGSQLKHFARTDDAVLAEELRVYAPDLIVLAFGTNEGFAPSIDKAAYEATLRAQVARIQRLAPDVPILLLGPPDALSRREELRGGAANCPAVPGVAPVFAPPGLAQVRAVQRKVAGDLHLAWWDWQARMGGPCSAQRWVGQGLMRGDYVHFRSEGGARIARLLQDDLEQAAREAR
ncbi:MAG: GDSL-type esterase/lipase family protein [Pseudomonadota bacterium]